MGYFVKFRVDLRIKRADVPRALEIANNLHSEAMVAKHAVGGCYPPLPGPITQSKWYSFVKHRDYYHVMDIFSNWHFITESYREDPSSSEFRYVGRYDTKIGQVDFLLQQLAPVLEDTTIVVKGEDGQVFHWTIRDHAFTETRVSRGRRDEADAGDEDQDEDAGDEDGGAGDEGGGGGGGGGGEAKTAGDE